MYNNKSLGSSTSEDSSIVTFDSPLVLKDQRILVSVRSVRFQTSLSCNASHLPENKVSDGILMIVIHSIQVSLKLLIGVSEGRCRSVEPYPRFDIIDKRSSNDGKKRHHSKRKKCFSKEENGEVLTLHQASRSPILSIPKWYRAWIHC